MANTDLICSINLGSINLEGIENAIEKVSQLNSALEEVNKLIEILNKNNINSEVGITYKLAEKSPAATGLTVEEVVKTLGDALEKIIDID